VVNCEAGDDLVAAVTSRAIFMAFSLASNRQRARSFGGRSLGKLLAKYSRADLVAKLGPAKQRSSTVS